MLGGEDAAQPNRLYLPNFYLYLEELCLKLHKHLFHSLSLLFLLLSQHTLLAPSE